MMKMVVGSEGVCYNILYNEVVIIVGYSVDVKL